MANHPDIYIKDPVNNEIFLPIPSGDGFSFAGFLVEPATTYVSCFFLRLVETSMNQSLNLK